nr:MAG TPA: hypothetical protein [Bacteriophage sp.]
MTILLKGSNSNYCLFIYLVYEIKMSLIILKIKTLTAII